MKDNFDAIIIGSGLGGLLSGAILAKKGYKPLILEKLSFFGGKFTSFNYYGYEIPTGAFHALPGAQYGNVGRL
ncbi:MAG: NAD(P)-binding protein, partial [Euryarchaeota archaeon]|nr:NAD(P)-binding protein [Euryarchaeota archaeon]